MFKKVLAGLTTLVLALGMVALTAGPASATKDPENDIDVLVACTTNHQYEVTWMVTNESDIQEEITVSNNANIPVGTIIAGNGVKTWTEDFASPTETTLEITGKWGEDTSSADKTLEVKDYPTNNCEPNHVKVDICHATPPATAAQGWNYINVDDDSIVSGDSSKDDEGHDGHAMDIIPTFTYWAKNVNGVWTQMQYPGKNLGPLPGFGGVTGDDILAGASELRSEQMRLGGHRHCAHGAVCLHRPGHAERQLHDPEQARRGLLGASRRDRPVRREVSQHLPCPGRDDRGGEGRSRPGLGSA